MRYRSPIDAAVVETFVGRKVYTVSDEGEVLVHEVTSFEIPPHPRLQKELRYLRSTLGKVSGVFYDDEKEALSDALRRVRKESRNCSDEIETLRTRRGEMNRKGAALLKRLVDLDEEMH